MKKSIHWFRNDLRVQDNPALLRAIERGSVLGVYIMEEAGSADSEKKGKTGEDTVPGAASRWWLHHSLEALDRKLEGRLCIVRGDPLVEIERLAKIHQIDAVYWNRRYTPVAIASDRELMARLRESRLEVHSYNSGLLVEPWEVLKGDGTPYKVFTPYYRRVQQLLSSQGEQLATPVEGVFLEPGQDSEKLARLDLLDEITWYDSIASLWQPGEEGALRRLTLFLREGLANYKDGRDYPAEQSVSRLSPHLHFGEISPLRLASLVIRAGSEQGEENQAEHFLRELVWREFSYYLLYHFPTMDRQNLRGKFDGFPWREDSESLRAWQRGMTGYPLVDAGMRELWQTGYMHNRVRMIVASFLVKNLMLHWHHGADWFWDCLLDADLASNSASWQWVAGSGTDSSPYFRIFNPVIQGKKFDPKGDYVREFIPELAGLPDKYLHAPFTAPAHVLKECGVTLGENYPEPVVDLAQSRERALNAYKTLASLEPAGG